MLLLPNTSNLALNKLKKKKKKKERKKEKEGRN